MPQDGTQVTDDGSGLSGGLGGYGMGGYGMLPMMMMGQYGMSSQPGVMDPGIYGAMARQRYAQSLMQQGMQATPVRSPWQAIARGVQGILGGYEMTQSERLMGQAQAQMQQQAAQGWQQAQDIINGAMQSGGGQPGAGPGGGPGGQAAPPQPGAYEGAILRHEGYGAPGNTSGPVGWGGFRPETWQAFAQANPDAFKGMTPDQILAARNDPTMVSRAITWLAQTNAPVLQRNNVPLSGQSLGLAHFLGGQGASWMWNAGDNTPARQVLEANLGKDKAATWIAANPQLGTKTVGQLKQDYAGFPNPVFLGAAGAGPGGGGPAGAAPGGGGPAPGSGYAAAIRLSMLGAQMAQNVTNPYAAAMGRNLMALAPRLAQIGQYGQPQPGPAPGTWVQTNPVTNEQVLRGQQLSPESYFANDFATLQQLTAKANGNWGALSPQEQQAYNEAWGRQSHLITDPATRRQTMTSPDMLVPGLLQPPGYSGGGAGGGPGGPAGGTRPVGQAGTAIEQTDRDSAEAMNTAAKAQAAAYGDESRAILQNNGNIRSLLPQTTPGRLSPITIPAAEIMQAFGISPEIIRQTTGQDPTAAQLSAKQLFTLLGDRIKQQGNVRAQALWAQFEKAMPSMESTPQTIDTITRMYDATVNMERKYADDRYNVIYPMRQQFRTQQNPAAWDEGKVAQFEKNWASQPENDPRVWGAAAMLAARHPQSVWGRGLSKQQIDLVEQLAARMYPSEIQYTPPGR